MLTSCAPPLADPDWVDPMSALQLDPLDLDPHDRDCPEDLPCRTNDPDLWFAESPSDLERAKALCTDCPARLACLSGALERREPWGVWGGEIFERGAVIARKRPRGRPRKSDTETRPAHEVAA